MANPYTRVADHPMGNRSIPFRPNSTWITMGSSSIPTNTGLYHVTGHYHVEVVVLVAIIAIRIRIQTLWIAARVTTMVDPHNRHIAITIITWASPSTPCHHRTLCNNNNSKPM